MMERTKSLLHGKALRRLVFIFAMAAALLGTTTGSFAQDSDEPEDDLTENWELMVGAGVMWSPIYPGAEDMELLPFPAIIASYDSPLSRWFIELTNSAWK